MKKAYISGICCAIVSCSSVNDGMVTDPGYASLSVGIRTDTPGETKSTAYLEEMEWERSMNSIQLTVFNLTDNTIEAYLDLEGRNEASILFPIGKRYGVSVIVNGPDMSGCRDIASYNGLAVGLASCSRDASKGFLMINGQEDGTMTAAGVSAEITVRRPAARAALVSVTNQWGQGEAIELEGVFLSNVLGKAAMSILKNYSGGNFTPPASAIADSCWINKEGRSDMEPRMAGNFIDGDVHRSSRPELTYADLGGVEIAEGQTLDFGSAPPLLYGFPNVGMPTGTNPILPDGFHTIYPKPRTCVVLQCRLRGTRFYYPVPLESFAANTAYTVALTIKGPGSFDPNVPVARANLETTVSEAGWTSAEAWNDEI